MHVPTWRQLRKKVEKTFFEKTKPLDEILKNREINILEKYTSVAPTYKVRWWKCECECLDWKSEKENPKNSWNLWAYFKYQNNFSSFSSRKISSNERWLWHVLYSFFGCSAHDPQRAHTLEVAIHSWAKFQKPAKNEIFKNREIDWLYLCLQRFNKFWISSPGNDRKRKLYESAETCKEKFVKSHQGNLFLVGFSHLEPLCHTPKACSLWSHGTGAQWAPVRRTVGAQGAQVTLTTLQVKTTGSTVESGPARPLKLRKT